MNAVFPSLFLNYFEKQELYLMANQLDNHLSDLKTNVEDENNINIHSVSKHFDNVLEELIKKY
jgi:hypothetical protein